MKNEQKVEDMIEILTHSMKYMPVGASSTGSSKSVCLTGDQLTCERIRGARQARIQSNDQDERFTGLIDMPSDWHALVTFYQVSIIIIMFIYIYCKLHV
jgi:hypothetical protein